jgi:peptidoglycan/LPS O-acetylase OafA/YrhL
MIIGSIGRLHQSGQNNFHLIRLFAALAVIYGHAWPITGTGGGDFYLMLVGNKFIGGVAVDIFFVISGFLIASSLERSSLPRYLWARGLRIYPALIVAVVLTVFLLGPILTTSADYWSSPTWRYLFKNALATGTEYFLPGVFETHPDHAVNGSLWSLPVEVGMYIIFAGLSVTGLLQRDRYTWLVVGLGLGALALAQSSPWFAAHPNWVNCSALFFAGGLVWKWRDAIVLHPLGMVGVLVGCVILRSNPWFEIMYSIALVYLVFFVAYAVKLPHIRTRDLSYGTYLYGWPAQQIVFGLGIGTTPYLNLFGAAAIAMGMAFLSWEFVERPMLRLKGRVG